MMDEEKGNQDVNIPLLEVARQERDGNIERKINEDRINLDKEYQIFEERVSFISKPFMDGEKLKNLYQEIESVFLISNLQNKDLEDALKKTSFMRDFEKKFSPYLSNRAKEEINRLMYLTHQGVCKYFFPLKDGRNIEHFTNSEFATFINGMYFLAKNNYTRNSDEYQYREDIITFIRNCITNPNISEIRRMSFIDLGIYAARSIQERLELIELIDNMREIQMNNSTKKVDRYTIATDSQNVHDSTLNTLYKRKIFEFQKDKIPSENITATISKFKEELSRVFGNSKKWFGSLFLKNKGEGKLSTQEENALTNIINSDITFTQDGIRLRDIFKFIFYRVYRAKDKDYYPDLLLRMKEELVSSDGYCSTGYLMRLINILSGYPEIDVEVVTFYIEEFEKKIREYFENDIKGLPNKEELENSYIGILDDKRKIFINFCLLRKKDWKDLLEREYLYSKQTHSKYLFMADFDDAWEKFIPEFRNRVEEKEEGKK